MSKDMTVHKTHTHISICLTEYFQVETTLQAARGTRWYGKLTLSPVSLSPWAESYRIVIIVIEAAISYR